MKKFLIVLIILSFAGIGSAQGFKLGIAGNVVFPTGDLKDATSSTGYGVDAFGVFDIMLLTLTVRAGYLSFGEKEFDLGGGEKLTVSTVAIPVMAGLRWDFGLPVGPSFYAGVEAGIHAFTTTYESSGTIVADPDDTETKFALAPNVGLEFAGFDLSAYYMIISDANYWGLRLGWGIGI
jgi:hypothetical protein